MVRGQTGLHVVNIRETVTVEWIHAEEWKGDLSACDQIYGRDLWDTDGHHHLRRQPGACFEIPQCCAGYTG